MNAKKLYLRKWILIALLAGSAWGSMPAQTGASRYRADRILVQPRSGVNLTALHTRLGTQVRRTYPGIQNLQVLQLPPLADPRAFIALYQKSGLVNYAELDFVVHALRAPNDFYFVNGALWGLHNTGQSGGQPDADIDAPEAWDTRTDARNVIIAVIDTGARYTHEDLAANMWVNPGENGQDFLGRNQRSNFLDDDGDGYLDDVHGINAILGTGLPWDDNGHGTHVCGTVGAVGNNGVGGVGVAWGAQLMALKFLDALGQGFISDAIECIDYARRKGANIINASWGSYSFSAALRDAIASTRDAGMIFVAAAGNDAGDNDASSLYPAGYDLDNLIAVAATTRGDGLASFSNFGATTVDLGAPGAEILSAWHLTDSSYQFLNGTSMASPHVAGACALVWAQHSGENYLQIKNRVLGGTDPLPALAGKCVSGGRLNVPKALSPNPPSPALPVVTVTATDPNASEDGDSGTLTITRTGSTVASLTVGYSLGGTASNGTDYQTLSGSTTIPAGSTMVDVIVHPIDDGLADGNETAVLSLGASTAYTIGSPGSASVTIADNDSALFAPIFGGVLDLWPGSAPASLRPLSLASGGPGAARNLWLKTVGGPAPSTGGPVAAGSDANPAFQVQLFGNPADVYVLQASADLRHWTAIATNEAGPDGVVIFTDPQAGSLAQRFYRGVRSGVSAAGAGTRPDRILVKPAAGANLSVLYGTLGLTVLKTLPAIGNLQIVRVPAGAVVGTILAALTQSGLVQYAERDYLVRALRMPDDVHFQDGSLWNLHNTGQARGVTDADIDAPEAWDTITDASDVIVAVIDTGVRYTHEDLAANMWVNPDEIAGNGVDDSGSGYIDDVHGINTLNGSGDPNDDHSHGTHVAGTIGAVGDNGVGVAGVAWRVQLMALKFIDAQGNGSISDAIICLDYARAHGAQVINASWGSLAFTSQALRDAIASARDAGIIFVAAAGNSSGDNDVQPLYPASYDLDNIVAVAATTRSDELAGFSNYGATTVHLGAPGTPIGSCWNTSDSAYEHFDGTSMAAAHVSGVAALLRAFYPNENHPQIINRLLQGVDPLPALAGRTVTGGRLNAQQALGATPPTPDTPIVTVTATDATASEAGETGEFTVSRTGDTGSSLTVNYALGGAAQNGLDYQTLSGSVTIPAGAGSADVIVAPIDDSAVEGNETVILTLSANSAYTVGSPGGDTVTIADEKPASELPVIWLSVSKPDASETGPDSGIIRFHRTGDPSRPVQVNWTFGGTAINGVDFEELPNGSPFPAGLLEADLTIRPMDDDEVEGDETVVVTLAPGSDYTIGSADRGTVIIGDNDEGPPPAQPTVTVTATAPNASEDGESATFTVSRTGSTASALRVDYTLNGIAENGTDYQNLSGSVTITAGSGAANITLTPIDDSNVEGSETAVLSLSANADYMIGSPGSATVAIADNDQPPNLPTVTVTADDANAAEPSNTGTFTVSRAGSTAASLTVNYTLNGTAQNGTDYQNLSSSVTISSGSSSANLTVTPIDDTAVEGSESAILTLSANSAYTIGSPGSATVTIADNDQPPPALAADFTASPLLGIIPLIVEFTDTSTGNPVSWNWNFGDGSSSTTRHPTHIYLIPGAYTVTLTGRNSAGATSSKSTVITATLLTLPLASPGETSP